MTTSSRATSLDSSTLDFRGNACTFLKENSLPQLKGLIYKWNLSYRLALSNNSIEKASIDVAIKALSSLPPQDIQIKNETILMTAVSKKPEIKIEYLDTKSSSDSSRILGIFYDQASNSVTIKIDSQYKLEVVNIQKSSSVEETLEHRLYELCNKDYNLRENLEIEKSDYFQKEVLPRLLQAREEALDAFKSKPGHVVIVSSKEEFMHFKDSTKASIRILPNGSTFIVLPGNCLHGGMKKLKYGIMISPDGQEVSVQLICKLLKNRRDRHLSKFENSFKTASQFEHPNILQTTAIIPHPKKKIEVIVPKCQSDLFDFLVYWRTLRDTVSNDPSKENSFQGDPIICVKTALRYIQETTLAMKRLYDAGYLHCDLKPDNVMLKYSLEHSFFQTKLIDFDFLTDKTEAKSKVGTPTYLPLTETSNNTLSTDLYALGRLIKYELRYPTEQDGPSFMDLFSALFLIANARKNTSLRETIRTSLVSVISLAKGLMDGSINSYDRVLTELDSIEKEFSASISK